MWKVILYILNETGIEIVYDTEENEFYKVESKLQSNRGEQLVLVQLIGEKSPISHFNNNRLLKLSDIMSGKISLNREIISKISGQNQLIVQMQNRALSEQNQKQNRDVSESLLAETEKTLTESNKAQGLIGVGKVNLMPFSIYYEGEIADVAIKVEEISDIIFKNTSKTETIRKTKDDYNKAVNFAKNGDLFELIQIGEKLKGRLNSQVAIVKSKDIVERKRIFKKKLYVTFVCVFLGSVLAFSLFKGFSNKTKNTDIISEQKVTFDTLQVLKIIEIWEQKNGKKIYDWRKGIVLEKSVGKTDNLDKVILLIESKEPLKINL